jgi:hypothetical protein
VDGDNVRLPEEKWDVKVSEMDKIGTKRPELPPKNSLLTPAIVRVINDRNRKTIPWQRLTNGLCVGRAG